MKKNRTLVSLSCRAPQAAPRLTFAALCAAALLFSAEARADGTSTKTSALPAAARTQLQKEIAAWRVSNPQSFAAVASVDGHKPEVYGQYRRPIPTTEREFRRLGKAALLPMLDALAFTAPERGSLTDDEWNALQVGMLEGVGVLRDRRAAPVLAAIFEAGNAAVVSAAAGRALGRLGGDAELAVLSKHAVAGDPLLTAAIAGLAECRRIESAKLLAGLLATTTDAALSETIASALGRLSSSWAWKTLGPAAAATGLAVREIAAKAFVDAFPTAQSGTRDAIRRGLQLAEHPSTLQLIDARRASAPAAQRPALDGLRASVAVRIK
jgi:hypothetical protein